MLNIRDGAAEIFGGDLQTEIIPRLEQHALRFFQPLPDGAPGRLPEIAALCVLLMRAPGHERNFHVRQRCARQHTPVLLFRQMGQHKLLPTFIQHSVGAVCREPQPASRLARLQQQVHLGVVAQRLEMSHALNGRGDRFLINNASRAEFYREPKAVADLAAQDAQLDLSHQMDVDFAQRFVPHNSQEGILLLQQTQKRERLLRVCAVWQQHLIGQYGRERRPPRV